MLMAVSCLSPVRTQICRPAWRNLAMVSGTPSCRRSSIPVAPGQTCKYRWAPSAHALRPWWGTDATANIAAMLAWPHRLGPAWCLSHVDDDSFPDPCEHFQCLPRLTRTQSRMSQNSCEAPNVILCTYEKALPMLPNRRLIFNITDNLETKLVGRW